MKWIKRSRRWRRRERWKCGW